MPTSTSLALLEIASNGELVKDEGNLVSTENAAGVSILGGHHVQQESYETRHRH